jgi:hypothetical protein
MAGPCGAKTRAGGTCKKNGMRTNGRCRNHGGASTGPKNPNTKTNALKHGFYSAALLPEERKLFDEACVGDIDQEIKLAKVKLFRFVKLTSSADLESLVDGAIEAAKKQETKFFASLPPRTYDKTEIRAVAPNYADLIIRLLESVRKLELSRAQMIALVKKVEEEDPANPTPTGFEVVHYDDEDGS